ncbi:stage V sporulation protein AD [Caldicellulosiruptor sp. F32]|uniref:stage V sporulation protein AD n=1 Tax=Caldicellulosiruptor sp. F32 TaxID=1214564 RepID=UPI00039F7D65|nr:stage V sporulation protein AD [Caldicellulosiruptor sp. F32]
MKKVGKSTFKFENCPIISDCFTIVGKKEGEGPLGIFFDMVVEDEYAGQKSWELAEGKLLNIAISKLIQKSGFPPDEVDLILSGDLLNQLTSSHFAIRDLDIPFIGLYGACSTFALSVGLACVFVDAGFAKNVIAATSSHFCSAEKQFRYPLELGCQRPPTAQWTVTGAASFLIKPEDGTQKPKITHFTVGKILDYGIKDSNNMGACMAPAAFDTITTHLEDTKRDFTYYDIIVTGDLGYVGRKLLEELFKKEGKTLSFELLDCGILMFDQKTQDTGAGASGCAASACVFGGYFYKLMLQKTFKRILIVPTGALLSSSTVQLGESIPVIAHALSIEIE